MNNEDEEFYSDILCIECLDCMDKETLFLYEDVKCSHCRYAQEKRDQE